MVRGEAIKAARTFFEVLHCARCRAGSTSVFQRLETKQSRLQIFAPLSNVMVEKPYINADFPPLLLSMLSRLLGVLDPFLEFETRNPEISRAHSVSYHSRSCRQFFRFGFL